jgi:hypothetical protein
VGKRERSGQKASKTSIFDERSMKNKQQCDSKKAPEYIVYFV